MIVPRGHALKLPAEWYRLREPFRGRLLRGTQRTSARTARRQSAVPQPLIEWLFHAQALESAVLLQPTNGQPALPIARTRPWCSSEQGRPANCRELHHSDPRPTMEHGLHLRMWREWLEAI